MREGLEACREFLTRIGAMDGGNAVAEILRKTGVELPESSPFRRRVLLATIRQEVDTDPMDVVLLFEHLLEQDVAMSYRPTHALFSSPLFPHLLVEKFAVAFEGLGAGLFKLENERLYRAEGIYELCLQI
ncbi:hypothetical protein PI124_g23150 [Phytophthora idaei]|nr:hypothetical protein PI125_g25054 [Phytophthora idaei]KAG3231754.1 hypothetical protein PI124_g23150 [Phytophthora idaei]